MQATVPFRSDVNGDEAHDRTEDPRFTKSSTARPPTSSTITRGDVAFHGLLKTKKGGIVTFDFPDGKETQLWRINAQGDVVGRYFDANDGLHGFLWKRREGRRD
jgi:hypothetical protein